MTQDLVALTPVLLHSGEPVCVLRMQASRANALEPALLEALHRAFDEVEAMDIGKVVIRGGRNFSSGGDVGRFLAAASADQANAYAQTVVPPLQDLILRMLSLPILFATAARGAVTGGAAGFLFAADIAVVAPDSFVQPYYGEMGFAPDGGWTAILPEKIGAGPALDWLISNRRRDADHLVHLGLAHHISPAPEDAALLLLDQVELGAGRAAKRLIWDETRLRTVQTRLQAEEEAFAQLIARPKTAARMQMFLLNKE